MNLPHLPFLVLDTETTGFVPRAHRVIEFASSEVRDGKMLREYEQLFACDEVPPHVEVLTRIRTESLQGKPTFESKRDEVASMIPDDAIIVGQNINFDIGMLKGEGIDLTERAWIDTSMLASLVFPELRSYSLGYLSTVLGLDHNPPHRALGDVRATLALLEKCWERLLELPADQMEKTKDIMRRSTPGYQLLFAALPAATATAEPRWMRLRPVDEVTASPVSLTIAPPTVGEVELREEPLDAAHLHSLVRGSLADKTCRQWIAVKNLRSGLRRLPEDLQKEVASGALRPLYPPFSILDTEARDRLLAQDVFTADESTLALKLLWHTPRLHDDAPVHGGEESVWNGKLACTEASPAYIAQFDGLPDTLLLDHRELLHYLESAEHPAYKQMQPPLHVIVDDASMLEDTATRAYGWYCAVDDLRAAAAGDDLLTRFTDLLQLWIEKVRNTQDLRYLAESDIKTPEASGLREQLDQILTAKAWPPQTVRTLQCVQKILDPENLGGRITWIELKQNGSQLLQSVPERIGTFLTESFYSRHPVTLLIPAGCGEMLPEILPQNLKTRLSPIDPTSAAAMENALPLAFATEPTLEAVLLAPPSGKTIILLPSKGMIEDFYVKHTERLEALGTTLICQGIGGGQGRMQAEFIAAEAPALWLLTPWMFEGIELPSGTVDHFLIKSLPFDYPTHPVLSKRANHYGDPFKDYSLPRLLHRLFRVLRTFSRIKTPGGDVRLMDERLFSKQYGKTIRAYLSRFADKTPLEQPPAVFSKPAAKPKAKTAQPKKPKADPGQLSIF